MTNSEHCDCRAVVMDDGRCDGCGRQVVAEQSYSDRDRRAEACLIARHGPDWYIGAASEAEWRAAYAAIDRGSRS